MDYSILDNESRLLHSSKDLRNKNVVVNVMRVGEEGRLW